MYNYFGVIQMITTIRKWGNSAGIRIPKHVLESSKISVNDELDIVTFDGGITFKKREAKSFRDIAKPLISTKGWKFDREAANERH